MRSGMRKSATVIGRRCFTRGLLVLPLLPLAETAAAGAAQGRLEVRVTDHWAGIADFRRLDVSLAEVQLHRQGAARNADWLSLASALPVVDIVPLKNGRFKRLGEGSVAAGAFDAVRVRFAAVQGVLKDGGSASLRARDTVVRTAFRVAAGHSGALLIDLYVENQTEHLDGRYVVKVRRVEVEA